MWSSMMKKSQEDNHVAHQRQVQGLIRANEQCCKMPDIDTPVQFCCLVGTSSAVHIVMLMKGCQQVTDYSNTWLADSAWSKLHSA